MKGSVIVFSSLVVAVAIQSSLALLLPNTTGTGTGGSTAGSGTGGLGLGNVLQSLGGLLTSNSTSGSGGTGGLSSLLSGLLKTVGSSGKGGLGSLLSGVLGGKGIGGLLGSLLKPNQSLPQRIISIIKVLIQTVIDGIKKGLTTVVGIPKKLINGIKSLFTHSSTTKTQSRILGPLGGLLGNISTGGSSGGGPLGGVGKLLSGGKTGGGLLGGLTGTLKNTLGGATGLVGKLTGGLKNVLGGATGLLGKLTAGLKFLFSGFIEKIIAIIKGIIKKVMGVVKGILGSLTGKKSTTSRDSSSDLEDFLNYIISQLEAFLDHLDGFLLNSLLCNIQGELSSGKTVTSLISSCLSGVTDASLTSQINQQITGLDCTSGESIGDTSISTTTDAQRSQVKTLLNCVKGVDQGLTQPSTGTTTS